ncbi:MAG TPA: YbaB/EbfC family nucleoid-associated protein [Candidatus Hydrogenedentes bacterium]|nr:YbaB/EbfC family nucleoid-associated protein [Candidatus Hydrogenedentota bacterium]
MLKGLGDLGKMGGIIKQAMEMKTRIDELKEKLGDMRIETSVGGDMVSIVMNGNMEVVSIKISPSIIDANDPETLEGLVTAAVNASVSKVQEMVKKKMTELTGGVDIPGMI